MSVEVAQTSTRQQNNAVRKSLGEIRFQIARGRRTFDRETIGGTPFNADVAKRVIDAIRHAGWEVATQTNPVSGTLYRISPKLKLRTP